MSSRITSVSGKFGRRLAAGLFVVTLALQSACSTAPQASEVKYHGTLAQVAVVTTSQVPDIRFNGLDQAGVVTSGSGATFKSCVDVIAPESCSEALCGAVAVLWTNVCRVADVVGGVIGALVAPSAGDVTVAESSLSTALSNAQMIQESLREQVVATSLARGTPLVSVAPELMHRAVQRRDYRDLAAVGVDTVLEVVLVRVGTERRAGSGPVQLTMQSHVRLISTTDNSVLFVSDYVHRGERRQLSEWSANRAELLLHGMKSGYEALGARIHDSIFFVNRNAADIGRHGERTLAAASARF